jgi:hypothetical protein
MQRRVLLLSDTIPERPAELRPIPRPRCQGQQQAKRSSSLKKNSAIHVQGEVPNLTIPPAIARREISRHFRATQSAASCSAITPIPHHPYPFDYAHDQTISHFPANQSA